MRRQGGPAASERQAMAPPAAGPRMAFGRRGSAARDPNQEQLATLALIVKSGPTGAVVVAVGLHHPERMRLDVDQERSRPECGGRVDDAGRLPGATLPARRCPCRCPSASSATGRPRATPVDAVSKPYCQTRAVAPAASVDRRTAGWLPGSSVKSGRSPSTRCCRADAFRWSRVRPRRHRSGRSGAVTLVASSRIEHHLPDASVLPFATAQSNPPESTSRRVRHPGSLVVRDVLDADERETPCRRDHARGPLRSVDRRRSIALPRPSFGGGTDDVWVVGPRPLSAVGVSPVAISAGRPRNRHGTRVVEGEVVVLLLGSSDTNARSVP